MHRTDSIKRWFSQYPGSLLLDQERACLEEVGHRCFGLLPAPGRLDRGEVSGLVPGRLRSQIIVAPEQPGTRHRLLDSGKSRDQLPIASDSVMSHCYSTHWIFYPTLIRLCEKWTGAHP